MTCDSPTFSGRSEQQAKLRPEAVAIAVSRANSYLLQLDECSHRVAQRLIVAGIQPGVHMVVSRKPKNLSQSFNRRAALANLFQADSLGRRGLLIHEKGLQVTECSNPSALWQAFQAMPPVNIALRLTKTILGKPG